MNVPQSQVKAVGVEASHNPVLLPVLTQIRAGRGDDGAGGGPSIPNHNETLVVRSDLKSGTFGPVIPNHNETLEIRTQVRAGGGNDGAGGNPTTNHNETCRA